MRYKLTNISIILILIFISTSLACGSDKGITTESGLKYIEIKEGNGIMPRPADLVEVNYTGKLEDGTIFDSTKDRGGPLEFALGIEPMIHGFAEGISMMKEGGKAKIIVPPELGYGGTPVGIIPANSTLVFEIELLAVHRPLPPQQIADEDYVVTQTGLKYYDLQVGTGPSPNNGDSITIDFSIWSLDGMHIGNSYYKPYPFFTIFGAGNLTTGLEEAISTMKVGGKRHLVIPPELVPKETYLEGLILPNSSLIIEVELLGITPITKPDNYTEINDESYTTTDTGLKYYDFAVGTGSTPQIGSTVAVYYTSWLQDGTKYASSFDDGEPLIFIIGTGQMIKGFEEGISTMKTGGRRQLIVPPELGYGDKGLTDQEGETILPNSTLIFEIILIYAS